MYKIKIALPENYQSLDDLELFLVNFVDEEIQVDFIEYPEEDFGDGGFVLWTDSEASFSEELSVEQSIENLREEEYRILESNWLTETQKIKSPISSLQDGWIFIEHPYRNPKKEFTVIPNVIFMELNIGVNADFLKKNKSIWGGSIKPDALRSIIGSFCLSICEKDDRYNFEAIKSLDFREIPDSTDLNKEDIYKEEIELKFFSKVIRTDFNLQNHRIEHFLEVYQNHQPSSQRLDSS